MAEDRKAPEWDQSGLPPEDEVRLLREALVRYGDRQRMATSFSMELQQVIDRAFERTDVPTSSLVEDFEARIRGDDRNDPITPSEAFDMGYAWAMSLRGQNLEDSRAVGRTLMSQTFDRIRNAIERQIRERGFDSFELADHGIVEAKEIIHAALDGGGANGRAVDPTGWLAPYRTIDASGDEVSAATVGWRWLERVAEEAKTLDPGGLHIETPSRGGDGSLSILYRGSRMVAFAFVMRDPMNYAVLMRYRAGNVLR